MHGARACTAEEMQRQNPMQVDGWPWVMLKLKIGTVEPSNGSILQNIHPLQLLVHNDWDVHNPPPCSRSIVHRNMPDETPECASMYGHFQTLFDPTRLPVLPAIQRHRNVQPLSMVQHPTFPRAAADAKATPLGIPSIPAHPNSY